MNNQNSKILIEIASYKDPELLNTVTSALLQADNPDRVYFSICYQSDDMVMLDKIKKIKNCKIKALKSREARGSCYARYLCQQMIDDEEYIYQIDSHMRFVKHWDTEMISALLSLKDENAIISFYPPACTEEMMALPLDDKAFDEPSSGGVMYVVNFQENSLFLSTNCIPIDMNDKRSGQRNPLIGAGNFFSYSKVHKEVIHDPDMYFYGDEFAMSVRLYTYGYNVYSYGKCYVYHQYERKNQEFPKVANAMSNELDRLCNLLGLSNKKTDMGKFGLGKKRTIEEYQKFAGIDIKNKVVYMSAENGEFSNRSLSKKISYFTQKTIDKNSQNNKTIEVLIVDLFGEYLNCITSCLNNSDNKNNIKFIVATTKNINEKESFLKKNHIKKIAYIEKGTTYCKALSLLAKETGDSFVAVVDSFVRFIKGWDSYYRSSIKLCGDNSLLTSWVWKASENSDINKLDPYTNVVKEFKEFNYYLPILYYNEQIKLAERKMPYKTLFISDGFIFCNSSILKKIKIDPNLSYSEEMYLYSLRLWTSGYDIYYPNSSFLVRTEEENVLFSPNDHLDIVCALSGLKNYYTPKVQAKYKYDVGSKRQLWEWYELLNVKYDQVNYTID